MLCYTDPNWDMNPVVVNAVKRVIKLFGTKHCFFASNFPPDLLDNWKGDSLYAAFNQLCIGLDREAKEDLFGRTARKAYRAEQ